MHLKKTTKILKTYKCVKLTKKNLCNDVEISNRQITLNRVLKKHMIDVCWSPLVLLEYFDVIRTQTKTEKFGLTFKKL